MIIDYMEYSGKLFKKIFKGYATEKEIERYEKIERWINNDDSWNYIGGRKDD